MFARTGEMQVFNYGSTEFVFWFGFVTILCFFLLDAVFSLIGNLAQSLAREAGSSREQREIQETETEEENFDDSNYPIG